MAFLNEDFLLSNEISKKLYSDYAVKMPIIDYHCHIDAKDIAENLPFENITKLWLGGDHYKWRYMRSCGIDEKYITGDATDEEKFFSWIKALSKAVGNPLYHWSHLELKRYFGFEGYVTADKAEMLWNMCNEKLSDMTPKSIIENSNVALLCTTDDPADDLHYHDILSGDESFKTKVLPAFRPDNAMNIEKNGYFEYIDRLGRTAGIKVDSFKSLIDALRTRMEYFNAHGCVLADHGLVNVIFSPATNEEIENIFSKRLKGDIPTEAEQDKFRFAFLKAVHREYVRLDWTSQIHFGCKRDNNFKFFNSIGANTGFDCIENNNSSTELSDFLNNLNSNDALPRMILYSLNPEDNAPLATVIGCFQNSSAAGKMQLGSAWWFNDHKAGMLDQISTLASYGNLSTFAGMLTDSRSFVSYTRHEYFRRILCDYLGTLVQNGEFPEDYDILGEIVEDISFNNAKRYFRFEL